MIDALLCISSDATFSFDPDTSIVGGFWSPGKITAGDVTSNSVKITWGAVDSATGYEVWRGTFETNTYVCIYSGTATSKVSTNLNPNTTYYYKVRAYKMVGGKKVYSDYTRSIEATTIPAPKITNITVLSGTRLRFSWNPVSGASGYDVQCSSETYADVTTTSAVIDLRSISDIIIDVRVRAYVVRDGEKIYGAASDVKTLVNNSVPANVRLSDIGRNSIMVTWDPQDRETYYEVWRSKSPTSGFVCLGRYSNTVKVSTSLSPNTTYYYKVRAYSYVYDDNGVIHRYYTGYSNVVSATTKK
jgi:fibronectin type 3 domain-containing protein